MKWKCKKLIGLMLGVSMMASSLVGCAMGSTDDTTTDSVKETKGGTAEAENETASDLEPMEISVAYWGIQEYFDDANAENDTIFDDLCKKFNISIKPMGVTWNDYQEKNKVWAASGSLPDIFVDALLTDNNALYQTWAKQGIIKEIPSDLSQYPNLSTVMGMDSVKAMSVDGKYYMIPRGNDPTASSSEAAGMSRPILYRKDWAAEAGYTQTPKTYEEMVEMIAAMQEKHPDAAGLSTNNIYYLATLALDIFPEYSNEGAWVYENEQWAPAYTSERVIPYIERLQKLYADGILDPDFMTQKDGDALSKFVSGHACAMFVGSFTGSVSTFMESNPEVANLSDALAFIPPFTTEDGNAYVYANTPYWSETYISASVDDAKLERILMLLDYMYSHEYATLVNNGIEGVDWERTETGNVSLLDESETLGDKYPVTSGIGYLASWFGGFDQSEDVVTSANPALGQFQTIYREMAAYETENCVAAPINFDVFLMVNDKKAEISSLGKEFVEKVNNTVIDGSDARLGWEAIIKDFEKKGLNEAIESVTQQAKEAGVEP